MPAFLISSARARVAPSPTGCPHLGNLLISVYNLLFKLKYNAVLILRLEDTDVSKVSAQDVAKVFNAFDSIKVRFDESPARIDKFGPYVQTQRLHIYSYYSELLVNNNMVFKCRCKWRRINALKRVNLALGNASVYDGKCLKAKLSGCNKCKLRLKVPRVGVFRSVSVLHWRNVEMQPLKVRNAFMFHLASVVDDHLMRVSHVLRGRDWAPSLAKHVLLYSYLGFKQPKFYHLPLLACSKGTKLSKRLSSCGVDACLDLGILPCSVLVYLASLVVGAKVVSLRKAISVFNLNADNRAHLRINNHNLLALNKRALARACLTPTNCDFMFGGIDAKHALTLCVKKSALLSTVYNQMAFVFNIRPININSKQYLALAMLACFYKRTQAWNKSNLETLHILVCDKLGISVRTLLALVYSGLFNTRDSISLYDSFLILGKERVLFRIELRLNKSKI
ncbi:glutamate--tRNA ligase family protein [Candidatus Hodgkinia cicadicola]